MLESTQMGRRIEIGDLLYHNTDKPCPQFNPDAENVLYFGRHRDSIKFVGGSGYTLTFEITDNLGDQTSYGSRVGWGIQDDWVSMPCELAHEALQFVSIISEFDQED